MESTIKVTYFIDNNSMTDTEFEDQEEKVFVITRQMIQDYVLSNDKRIKKGDMINEISFELSKKF